jgi:hypothetical protein
MLFSLLYMVLRFILRLAPAGEARDREAEILVLSHQVRVLQRKAPRPSSRASTSSSSRPTQLPTRDSASGTKSARARLSRR